MVRGIMWGGGRETDALREGDTAKLEVPDDLEERLEAECPGRGAVGARRYPSCVRAEGVVEEYDFWVVGHCQGSTGMQI